MSFEDRWRHERASLEREGRYRALRAPAGIDFSSNDYLGYAKRAWPTTGLSRSGTASRLLRGQHHVWEEVEARLAAWHRAEAALVMNSGYSANEGLLSTVIQEQDLVFSDQANHASIIDGLRLSRAEKVLFQHNDAGDLEVKLRARQAHRPAGQEWFIVTESLFGMDGDVAPLRELANLAQRWQANLIVDEAHATGCFHPSGSGLVDALGVRSQVLATMHTGGKALAVPGAYIACSALLKDLLVNRCRHLIYTTALPPQVGQWWLDTLALVALDETTRTTLHDRTSYFRAALAAGGGMLAGGSDYIVSLVLGPDAAAVEAGRRLQEQGFDVRAIRPPTVPANTARLRISIHADHDPDVLTALASACRRLT